jgi:hypothetical protein
MWARVSRFPFGVSQESQAKAKRKTIRPQQLARTSPASVGGQKEEK